ncbi:hypothetical protein Bca101_084164 [Brassica carinata]
MAGGNSSERLTFYHFVWISGTLSSRTTMEHHTDIESMEFWNGIAKGTMI